MSISGNQSDILNQPIRRQLNVMRSIAKTFRVVMNKRYAQPVVTPNEAPIPELSNIPDKIENEMANQIEGLTSAVSSTLSNNDNNILCFRIYNKPDIEIILQYI